MLAFETHAAITHDPSPAVQERGLHEVHAVFNTEHHAGGDISDNEFALLDAIVASADGLLAAPNLLVHLDAPVEELARRIRSRGRTEERAIDTCYLKRMNARYQAFVEAWSASPVLPFDSVRHDLRGERGRAVLVGAVRDALRSPG